MGAKVLKLRTFKEKKGYNLLSTPLDEFFDDKLTSENSKKSYRSGLKNFHKFISSSSKYCHIGYWEDVERDHVIAWRTWMYKFGKRGSKPAAPKTINLRLTAVEEYFKFLINYNKSDLKRSPCTAIKRANNVVLTETNVLTPLQFREMLSHAKTHPKKAKYHTALLLVFFLTGLRHKEVMNLKFDDYSKHDDLRLLKAIGKGRKPITKVLSREVYEAIDEHLLELDRVGRKRKRGDYLFPTPQNPHDPENVERPWHHSSLIELFEGYARKAEINFNVTPHSARATLITTWLDAGENIYEVAQEINHSSVKTTEEYDKRRKKRNSGLYERVKL